MLNVVSILLSLCAIVLPGNITGALGYWGDYEYTPPAQEKGADIDNRPGLIYQSTGETTTNSFFEWTVHSITAEIEYYDYLPDDNYIFVVADISVKNIFKEGLPVGNYDYFIQWGDGEWDWAYDAFHPAMFPDDVELPLYHTLRGDLVFEIPADVRAIQILYEEIWDDDSIENTYVIEADLSARPAEIMYNQIKTVEL